MPDGSQIDYDGLIPNNVGLALAQASDQLGHIVGIVVVVEITRDDGVGSPEAAKVEGHASSDLAEASHLIQPHRVVGHECVQEDGERA